MWGLSAVLKKRIKSRRGFTLVELMVAIVIASIVVSSVCILLADGQRGWRIMYDHIYADVVSDGYVARRKFDTVMRNASWQKYSLDETNNAWVEVYYYQDANSTVLDRYARFEFDSDNGELNFEEGILDPLETVNIQTLCGSVSDCVFQVAGRSVQMVLKLDNGLQSVTVTSSAVMHNY